MAIPAFDISIFRAQYPMYASIPDAVLIGLWIEVDEMGTPIIISIPVAKQEHYYYIVEAHLAELWLRGPGANGILSEAEQGTVRAAFEVDKSNAYIWWNQTAWGAKIVALMKMRGGFIAILGSNNYYNLYS